MKEEPEGIKEKKENESKGEEDMIALENEQVGDEMKQFYSIMKSNLITMVEKTKFINLREPVINVKFNNHVV
jgi:hypothetical protein